MIENETGSGSNSEQRKTSKIGYDLSSKQTDQLPCDYQQILEENDTS